MDIKLVNKIKESIFNEPSENELRHRKDVYDDIRIQEFANRLVSRRDCVRNPDGSYSFQQEVILDDLSMSMFPIKFDTIGRNFDCTECGLISLKGGPKEVYGSFNCDINKLKSLYGAPEYVGGDFSCRFNNIKTLDGAPKVVDGDFYCSNNPTKFTKEDVEKVCKVGGSVWK